MGTSMLLANATTLMKEVMAVAPAPLPIVLTNRVCKSGSVLYCCHKSKITNKSSLPNPTMKNTETMLRMLMDWNWNNAKYKYADTTNDTKIWQIPQKANSTLLK